MAEGTTPLFVNWRTGKPTNPYGSQAVNVWVPTLTFDTVGDLAVTYSTRVGTYLNINKLVFITFNILTSSFTFTTASGTLRVSGIPFNGYAGNNFVGTLRWGGITMATPGYTDISSRIPGSGNNKIEFRANGSGLPGVTVAQTDTPTGSTINLNGSILYIAE